MGCGGSRGFCSVEGFYKRWVVMEGQDCSGEIT